VGGKWEERRAPVENDSERDLFDSLILILIHVSFESYELKGFAERVVVAGGREDQDPQMIGIPRVMSPARLVESEGFQRGLLPIIWLGCSL